MESRYDYPDDMNDWKKEMFEDVKDKLNNPIIHGYKISKEENKKHSNGFTKESVDNFKILLYGADMDVKDFIAQL